jgi:hypothetical protein
MSVVVVVVDFVHDVCVCQIMISWECMVSRRGGTSFHSRCPTMSLCERRLLLQDK